MKERWKPIAGFEGLYDVSDFGNVRSLPRRKKGRNGSSHITKQILLRMVGVEGYSRVSLHKNGIQTLALVHRLVATAFIPNPLALRQVNHIDCSRNVNHFRNLEWVTAQENTLHAVANGKFIPPIGEKNGHAKLTEGMVLEIRALVNSGVSRADVAKQFLISASAVSLIATRKRWRYLK